MVNGGLLGIGEFSKAVGITVKALRLYHERGLLVPARIDASTGYRYYDHRCAERARAIVLLRGLEFSLEQIGEMLAPVGDDDDVLAHLERQQKTVEERLAHYSRVKNALEVAIAAERRAEALAQSDVAPQQSTAPPLLIAGLRARGAYSETGARIGQLARRLGRAAAGAPFNLYYEQEFRDGDADFETCVPIEHRLELAGVEVHELPGGPCWSVVHRGPYEHLGRAYQRLFEHLGALGQQPTLPLRELYIKGPGMFFRGNPHKYVTEVQALVT